MDDRTVKNENIIDETSMYATLTRADALDTLLGIDKYLSTANKATEGLKFSSDPDTALIEKAVLYHRIRTDSQLADRYTTTLIPDQVKDRITKLHGEITGGRDSLAEYIKSRENTDKKVDFVLELTQQDRNKAWFEVLIETAEQKKAEAEEIRRKIAVQMQEMQLAEEEAQVEEPEKEQKRLQEELNRNTAEMEENRKKLVQAEKEIRQREESLNEEEHPEEQQEEPDKAKKEEPQEDPKPEIKPDSEEKKNEDPQAEQNPDLNNGEVLQQGLDLGGRNPVKEKKNGELKPEEPEKQGEPDKKGNKEKPEEVKKAVPQTSAEKLKAEADLIQQGLLNKILENPDCTPKEFMAKPENLQALRRLTAIQLHQSQIDQQYSELAQALKYGRTREERIRALQNRPPFEFEKAVDADMEAHLQRLENTTEVAAVLQSMAGQKNIQHLASEISWPPKPHPIPEHDNLALMEKEMIPGAIKEFLNGPDKPAEGSDLEKKLSAFIKKDKDFPDKPTAEECEARIKEYRKLKEALKDVKTQGGKELAELLGDQIGRLEDVTLAPEREKVEFNFKPDSLIEYFDPAHPDEPMDAVEAREKLIRGVELEQRTFDGENFMGTSRKVSFDKKTGMIKKGPEKLITRVVDLSEKNSLHPEQQLDDLKQIREVLKKSDPFYKKNPESFKKTMECLDKVIKTQGSLNKDSDIHRVLELRNLYAELDKNMMAYLSEKDDELKAGGEKAHIRSDALWTLKSILPPNHLDRMCDKLYPEHKEMHHQRNMADKYYEVFAKWRYAGVPKDEKSRKEFMEDFSRVSDGIEKDLMKDGKVTHKYTQMSMSRNNFFDKFIEIAEEVKKAGAENFDDKKLETMKAFSKQSKEAIKEFNKGFQNAQPKKDAPKKEIEAPKKSNNGPSMSGQ